MRRPVIAVRVSGGDLCGAEAPTEPTGDNQKGLARGVFSNEAGLGSSVIAHSASETREPVKSRDFGAYLRYFFDTFVICTLTALVILTTNIPVRAHTKNGTFFGFNNRQVILQALQTRQRR